MPHTLERIPTNFLFREPNGTLCPDSVSSRLQARYTEHVARLADQYQYTIDTFSIEKSPIFLAEEEKARQYIQSLGFSIDTPIFLIDKEDPDDLAVIHECLGTYAWVSEIVNAIIVRQSQLEECKMYETPASIGSLLVHELAHAAAPEKTNDCFFWLQEIQPEQFKRHEYGRTGFNVLNGSRAEGTFYEEAFAQYVAGRYLRSLHGDMRAIGLDDTMAQRQELPAYFQPPRSDAVCGPDAYTLELIAMGLEKKDVITTDDFAALLLATRHQETQLEALRAFAQAVDMLEPGLYTHLRKLKYGKGWPAACEHVRSLVTTLLPAA